MLSSIIQSSTNASGENETIISVLSHPIKRSLLVVSLRLVASRYDNEMIWMISGIYHSSHYIYEPISNNELVFNIMVRERNFPVRNVRNEKLNSEKKNKLPENSN
ncbi:Phosphoserine phosphatase [Dirofilaria immitis]